MKIIKVPYLPGLERLTPGELDLIMEERAARGYIDQVNWPDQFPAQPLASFLIARSDTHLFVSYFVRGLNLRAVESETNGSVWEDSCVEFFVQDPGSPLYYNFEFNCMGTTLASRRTNPEDRVFHDPDQVEKIIRYCSVTGGPFEEKDGVFVWSLTAGIPFELFGFTPYTLPSRLRANFYKCGDKTAWPHFLSWSPIDHPTPNFHLPRFFGEIVFM